MLDAAIQLAELGFFVLPIRAGEKTPATMHGLKDATTDAATIEKWWTLWPNANVAIRTDGLLVVDIDVGENGAPNNWLADDPEKLLDLAAGVLSLTPRGGRHYIFKQPAGVPLRNTAGKLADRVDTRGDGGYFLVDPSVVNDKPYRWAPGSALDCRPEMLPEPPAWLVDQLREVERGPSIRLDTAHANAIPSGQRNDALTALAGSMRRVGMSQDAITAALLQENAKRCNPPMAEDEVEKIAWSVSRYEPDQIATAVAECHAAQLGLDAPPSCGPVDPGPIPAELLRIPGFVNDVVAYTLANAPYPDPVLAFAGALALQAFLASRKVRDPGDARPNVFILALANSGAGKDFPRKVNQRILMASGQADCIGDTFASAEGLEDALFARPAMLFQTDELDALLNAIKSGREARYEGIMAGLLKFYSNVDGVYSMRTKAGREAALIDQPALTLFGTAIPKNCYEALSAKMLANGLFARLLILEAGARCEGQDAGRREIPESIIKAAQWWQSESPGEQRANLAAWHPTPRIVPRTDSATKLASDFRARMDREYMKAQEASDNTTMSVIARADEKARRLALLYAVSVNHIDPIIDDAAVCWACAFVDYATRRMLYMASINASENEFDAKCNRFLEVLRQWHKRAGDGFMPGWDLNRRIKGWQPRDFEEVKKTLLGRGSIERQAVTHDGAGRPGEAYRLR